jgi:hypothetical protein
MSESNLRRFALALTIVPYITLGSGCGQGTDVELAKVPLVQIPEPKAPEEQPKHLRPSKGSSAGMGYDPSGVVPR